MLKGFKATDNPKIFYRIGQDDKGKESSRIPFHIDKQKGFAKELSDFLENNGVVEEAETEAEKSARESEENKQALLSQKSQCVNLLNKTQHKVNGDYDYSADDVELWKNWRNEVKRIMRLSEIETIPDPPFQLE